MSYARQIAAVASIIAKKGQAAIWTKPNEQANVSQPWKTTAGVPSNFPVNIVRVPVGGTSAFKTLIKGSSVSQDRERILMPGNVPFTPELNDTITVNGISHRIEYLDTIQPDGNAILHVFSMT